MEGWVEDSSRLECWELEVDWSFSRWGKDSSGMEDCKWGKDCSSKVISSDDSSGSSARRDSDVVKQLGGFERCWIFSDLFFVWDFSWLDSLMLKWDFIWLVIRSIYSMRKTGFIHPQEIQQQKTGPQTLY